MASKLPICQIASYQGSKKLCVPIGIWAFLCPRRSSSTYIAWPPWPRAPPLGHSSQPLAIRGSYLCIMYIYLIVSRYAVYVIPLHVQYLFLVVFKNIQYMYIGCHVQHVRFMSEKKYLDSSKTYIRNGSGPFFWPRSWVSGYLIYTLQ